MKRLDQKNEDIRYVEVGGIPVTEDMVETLDLMFTVHQQKVKEKRIKEELNKRGINNILFIEKPHDRSPERLNRLLKIIEVAVEAKEF